MNALPLATSIALLMATTAPAIAADEPQLQRLATCKDSWFEWKNDKAKQSRYVDFIKARFVQIEHGGAYAPKVPTTVFGLQVSQVFPGTVGMAVGFSMIVNADFAKARKIFEKQLGHLMKCESGDGMKTCKFQIEDKWIASS
jgi:hypothetical protein